jgi:hypothetical protein
LTVVLIACGLWTAGAGGYVAITAPTETKYWPDAAPIIVDQTTTMPIDTANRIWWAADDLWRKETVLTSFEIVKPAPGTNAPSVELPKSGAVIEPAFRMAVGIMAHQNPKVSIAVSTQLRSHLGEGCIEQAVQPLLEREARTRVWDYVAGLGIAFAAAKVTVRADLIKRSQYWWLPIGVLAFLLGFALLFTQKRSNANDPQQSLVSALKDTNSRLVSLRENIEASEEEQKKIQSRLEATGIALAEAHQAADAPSWKTRIRGLSWMIARANRHRLSKLEAEAQRIRDALKNVQQSRSSAEDEYNDRIAQTVQRVQRRTARVATKRRLAVVCALIVSVLAATLATYDALALADQSMRLFAARRTFVALLPGSLLYSALESNRGLIESFRNRCGIEITLPTPIMTQPMPRPTPIERPVVAPDSGIPAQLNCSIGKPCGQSCIPQDHVCHIDATAPVRTHDMYRVHGYFRANGTYVAPYSRHYPRRHK